MLDDLDIKAKVCLSLIYKWHKSFAEGSTSEEDDSGLGRKEVISSICDLMEEDRQQTVVQVAKAYALVLVQYTQDISNT